VQGAHYLSDCLFSLPQGLLILTATGTPPRWLAALPSQPQRADDAMPARQASLLAASCCWLLSLHPAVRLTGSTQGVAAALLALTLRSVPLCGGRPLRCPHRADVHV
jgi:hypothetical protein